MDKKALLAVSSFRRTRQFGRLHRRRSSLPHGITPRLPLQDAGRRLQSSTIRPFATALGNLLSRRSSGSQEEPLESARGVQDVWVGFRQPARPPRRIHFSNLTALLQRPTADPSLGKPLRQPVEVRRIIHARHRRGSDFQVNSRIQQQTQALPSPLPGARHAGNALVVLGQRLDVESHPVHQRQELREALRVGAAGVQADLEAHCADLGHGGAERPLGGGLATGEDHGVQQAAAAREEVQHLGPGGLARAVRVLEVGVVTVGAAPGAAAAVDHGGQLARVVEAGERGEAAQTQLIGTWRKSAHYRWVPGLTLHVQIGLAGAAALPRHRALAAMPPGAALVLRYCAHPGRQSRQDDVPRRSLGTSQCLSGGLGAARTTCVDAARLLAEADAVAVLGLLARVEGAHRPVVAHDAGPDLAAGTFFVVDFDVINRHCFAPRWLQILEYFAGDSGCSLWRGPRAERQGSRLGVCSTDQRGRHLFSLTARLSQLAPFLFDQLRIALGAELVLALDVAVVRADGEGGRDGDVGQAEIGERAAHQALAGIG